MRGSCAGTSDDSATPHTTTYAASGTTSDSTTDDRAAAARAAPGSTTANRTGFGAGATHDSADAAGDVAGRDGRAGARKTGIQRQ